MTPRRLLTTLLSLTLAITLIITSKASPSAWNAFFNSSEEWMKAVTGLFTNSQIGPVVSAQQIQNELNNWLNWPNSKKHKGFDGGWILPFEIYEQRYIPVHYEKGGKERYEDLPLSIDINGDGLLDLVYSKVDMSYRWHINEGSVFHGVEQYIILRRANGFELAYKCRQKVDYEGYSIKTSTYYGDCAETNYSGNYLDHIVPWNSARMFMQEAIHWTNSNPIQTDAQIESLLGKKYDIYDQTHKRFDGGCTTGCVIDINDFKIPRFMDMNGDGLPDLVFIGANRVDHVVSINYQGKSYTSTTINAILYNTGRGFELGAACVSVISIGSQHFYYQTAESTTRLKYTGKYLPGHSGTICY